MRIIRVRVKCISDTEQTFGVAESVFHAVSGEDVQGKRLVNLETGEMRYPADFKTKNKTWQRVTLKAETGQSQS